MRNARTTWTRMIRWTSAAGAAAFLASPMTAAEPSWQRVNTPHFTVLSNAGERTARDVAWRFEQISSAIARKFPWASLTLDRPVVVLAAKDESTMHALAPQYWETKGDFHPDTAFATGSDAYFIALRTDLREDDSQGVNPYREPFWAYCSVALQSGYGRSLPLWLANGIAAVLSNTIVNDKEIQFGRPIFDYVEEMRQGVRPPIGELLKVTRDSPQYLHEPDRSRFDAQSWELVEYLMFGLPETDAQTDRVNTFVSLLIAGKPSDAAIQQVFGSVDALDVAYRLYTSKGVFRYTHMAVNDSESAKDAHVGTLTPADTAVAHAAFHAAMNRPVDARAAIAAARNIAPDSAGSYDVEGQLLERENHADAARDAFAKAVDLHSTDFYSYYRLANLTWPTTADAAALGRVRILLQQAIALNETFAPAYYQLGSLLRVSDLKGAADADRHAVDLDPGQTSYRMALASVFAAMGQPSDAMAEAQKALAAARTDTERQTVQRFIATLTPSAAK